VKAHGPTPESAAVRGLWYEDFEIGAEFGSPGRTITEADVVAFAALTGDYSPVHIDAHYASTTPFGARIAHGLLGLAIAQGLCLRSNYNEGTGIASLAWNRWTFLKPIMLGDTVHARWRVLHKRESRSRPNEGIVTERVALLNQHGVEVQEGEHVTLMHRRPSPGAA
jgi:acyl dehydratase